ncbi:CRISPR-associated protein Cas4 [Halostella pelagica]|uniref:CRISPR-associated protein Cas4 n=1 Tax=Halostella pelagica TaxID=2583824 RepID=UPI0010814D18|nr:PD-(D/E)XK nuclease family protein [Halostella pelagica]
MSDPPRDAQPSPTPSPPGSESEIEEALRDRVTNRAFNEWYSEQQFQSNILEGKAYFNGPSPSKDPEQHTPSKLLQCHRKATYSRQNAPREGTQPEGLFWFGTEFEEQVVVPFLQSITTPDTYVTNSVWTDTELVRDGTSLRVRGATDPAIVTADADPLLVTEIKTTTSLDHLSAPKPHHRAQLHAYLHALNTEHDHDVMSGLIVYGSRETLNIKAFSVDFDPAFWDDVVTWMDDQTAYEQAGELPPASPERDWECNYCSFKHRCGQADTPYTDIGVDGLLPVFDGYDREKLQQYLDGHADREARLTPTLAHVYPGLSQEYDVYDWSCAACNTTYAWDEVETADDSSDPPYCPCSADDGDITPLSGPEPHQQLGK